MSPTVGKISPGGKDIEIFPARKRVSIKVRNTGDRGIQVGSHFHFFEANRALDFDRGKAYGMKLDLPSGTAIRLEPGQEKTVTLVEYGGKQYVHGFNNLVDGSTKTKYNRILATERAKKLLFKGA
ncbi:MAG TPA: urease subunit beta [Methanoregula sp.]|nr:urease subunit beta [Methanoregula sp.]